MISKDREFFDVVMDELKRKLKETKLTLEERVEMLETVVFWSLVCDANEQGITPEQKEMLRLLGWDKLFAKTLGLPWDKMF